MKNENILSTFNLSLHLEGNQFANEFIISIIFVKYCLLSLIKESQNNLILK
jgi:hypothetical protein